MSAEYKSDLPLVGIDGNAYSVMATIDRGLRQAGAPPEYRKRVITDMMSGDYEHLLNVAINHTTDDALGRDARDDE
jgi:hypothetical protein